MRAILFVLVFLLQLTAIAQKPALQSLLDSLRVAGNYPGLSVSLIKKDNTQVTLVSGFNDKEKNIPMKASDRLLQGSVGKTYASAIAVRLIKEGKLKLDEKVSTYLGKYSWYPRIPNAADITVRMIMNHSSGVMRYEFKDQFLKDLKASVDKAWKPEELLQYVLDEKASFAAGEGWEYSDTNYILLGMIIESLTGKKYYELVKKDLLIPHQLYNTFPSDSRVLKGLSQGYAGEGNEFTGKDKVIGEDGKFLVNPQFEWTGGGIYSTTADLAKWGKLLYEGKIVDTSLLLSSAVAAKLGRDTKYALGVIIRQSNMGTIYGHSGFFPGYLTELLYFPQYQLCLAIQANSSDFKNIKLGLQRAALVLAKASLDQ